MDLSTSEPVDSTNAAAPLGEDIPCRRCSYNLRGLRPDGLCPECGTPVGLSTRLPLLCYADPDWLKKVVRGLTIILWMILVGLLAGVLSVVLQQVGQREFGQILALGAGIVSLYGVWLMTTPDPSGIGEDPNITARKVVRFALVVGLVSQVLGIVSQNVAPAPPVMWLVWGLIGACTLVGLVGEFAKFIFYEQLARRIPDRALATRARFLKWAWTVTFGASMIIAFTVALISAVAGAPGAGTGAALGAIMCLAVPVGLGFVVFAVMTLFLLIRLRRAIIDQANVARTTWAVATTRGPTPPDVG